MKRKVETPPFFQVASQHVNGYLLAAAWANIVLNFDFIASGDIVVVAAAAEGETTGAGASGVTAASTTPAGSLAGAEVSSVSAPA